MGKYIHLFCYILFVLTSVVFHINNCQSEQTFNNPIFDGISPDPSILKHEGNYYLVLSIQESVFVLYKSEKLTDFRNTESNVIFRPNSSYDANWAPELHEIDGQVYVYFSMHKTNENDHRMWVTKAINSSNLMGEWTNPIQLMTDEAEDANDGTIFKHPVNRRMYYVWTSLRPGIHQSSLYIAPMIGPYIVSYPRVLLRVPGEIGSWDCLDACLNEGAHMIYSTNNISHLIFSGSGAGSLHYSLGRMSIQGHLDPLVPNNWEPVVQRIFHTDDLVDVYGPGHAAFTTSPDGTETWMAYHAQNTCTPNNIQRIANLEKIDWDENGYPIFPNPHGYKQPQRVPSGQ